MEEMIALAALVFVIVFVGRGYQRGLIVEISGLLALVAAFLLLLIVEPVIGILIPASFGRIARAACWITFCVVVFVIVKALVKNVGEVFRKIPIIGFLVAVLGGLCGFIKAILMLLILRTSSGIDAFGAVSRALDKLPFGI